MCVPNDEVETVLNFYLQDSNKTRTIQKLLQDDLEVGIEGFIRIYLQMLARLVFLSWLACFAFLAFMDDGGGS